MPFCDGIGNVAAFRAAVPSELFAAVDESGEMAVTNCRTCGRIHSIRTPGAVRALSFTLSPAPATPKNNNNNALRGSSRCRTSSVVFFSNFNRADRLSARSSTLDFVWNDLSDKAAPGKL